MVYFGTDSESKSVKEINTGSEMLNCFLWAFYCRVRQLTKKVRVNSATNDKPAILIINDKKPIMTGAFTQGKDRVSYLYLDDKNKVKSCDLVINPGLKIKAIFKKMQPYLLSLVEVNVAPTYWEKEVIKYLYVSLSSKAKNKIAMENGDGKTIIIHRTSKLPLIAFEKSLIKGKLKVSTWKENVIDFSNSILIGSVDKGQLNYWVNSAEKRIKYLDKIASGKKVPIHTPEVEGAIPTCSMVRLHDQFIGFKNTEVLYLPVIKPNGNVMRSPSKVVTCYEKKQKLYHISKYSYDEANKYGHVLLRDMSKQAKIKKGETEEDWATESVLKQLGYSVARSIPLKTSQRRSILLYAINKKIMDRDRVISFLSWVIHMHQKEMYDTARDRWESDIEFVRQTFGVSKRR